LIAIVTGWRATKGWDDPRGAGGDWNSFVFLNDPAVGVWILRNARSRVTVDGSPAGRREHMVPPTLSRAWMPGLGSGPRGASVLGPFRAEVCLEIRGKAAWPTTPVVTSKLDRQLVAGTRKAPSMTRDWDLQTAAFSLLERPTGLP
jgi:hypothetical protein